MHSWFKTFWNRNFIQDTPVELSQCEFGCRKTNCRHGAWEGCKNRLLALQREAAYAKAALQANSAATGASPAQPRLD